jgi:hypothetical protein
MGDLPGLGIVSLDTWLKSLSVRLGFLEGSNHGRKPEVCNFIISFFNFREIWGESIGLVIEN